MDTSSAVFMFASSVSLAGFVTSFIGKPGGGLIREREVIRKGIQKSLSELDDEIWQLNIAALDAENGEEEKLMKKMERLVDLRVGLTRAEKEFAEHAQEEWARVRDETLGTLDEARRYFLNEHPEPVTRRA
jgi:hypothetical protein